MASKKVKKERTSKRGKGEAKQSVNVSIRIGDTKPKRKRQYKRRPKAGGGGDLARVGETRTLYGNLPPPPPQQIIYTQPQAPQLPPAFQPQPQIAGLLEDVKRERQNLLEDIQREVKSTAIKEIQKAQGAEQRSELAKIGFQEPVALPKLMEKAQEPIKSFDEIIRGGEVLPFEDESFLESEFKSPPKQNVEEFPISSRVKELKTAGRKKESKNRPKEVIQAEKKAKEEARIQRAMKKALDTRGKKSKIPTLDIEQQRIIPIQTQREFNLLPSNLATMPTGLPF